MSTLFYYSFTKGASLDGPAGKEEDNIVTLSNRQASKLVSYIMKIKTKEDYFDFTACAWSCLIERESFPAWVVDMVSTKKASDGK